MTWISDMTDRIADAKPASTPAALAIDAADADTLLAARRHRRARER